MAGVGNEDAVGQRRVKILRADVLSALRRQRVHRGKRALGHGDDEVTLADVATGVGRGAMDGGRADGE